MTTSHIVYDNMNNEAYRLKVVDQSFLEEYGDTADLSLHHYRYDDEQDGGVILTVVDHTEGQQISGSSVFFLNYKATRALRDKLTECLEEMSDG